jgi:hypothetical protein
MVVERRHGCRAPVAHAALDTRVAWVRDVCKRIDDASREERAVVVWQAATDECVTARIQWRISKEPGDDRRAPCGMLGAGAQ